MQNKRLLGKIGLLVTAMVWGSGSSFTSVALGYFTTFQIMALRFTIAAAILFIINFRKLKQIKKQNLIKGIIIGLLLFLAYIFQTFGLGLTTVSKSSFLTSANVVIVPFLAWIILRNGLSANAVLGAVVSLVGIGFTSFSGGVNELTLNFGDVLTLFCAFFFAAHVFYTEYYGNTMDTWIVMLVQMSTVAVLSWISVLVTGETNFIFTVESTIPIIYISIVTTLIGYGIQTAAQKYTTSGESAVILSTEAFFGMFFAILFLGEPALPSMIVGGILISIGVLIVELKPLKNKVLVR